LLEAVICDNEVHALNLLEESVAAVVLLHYAVRKTDTPEYIEILRKANTNAEIIIIGDDVQDERIIQCILAGAKGYQNIDSLERYVEKLIEVVGAGEAWFTRKMVGKLINYWNSQ
jgi:DNA-binding NarL/FixJ family response regulator